MFNWIPRALGRQIANFLIQPRRHYERFTATDEAELQDLLKPGDVLLVEGNRRISTAIMYLTQSTWSHSCLYVGDALQRSENGEKLVLVEADLLEGIHAVPLSKFSSFNVRICRPVGLTEQDTTLLISFVIAQLGYKYDLKNVVDLTRYLLPVRFVPARFRRRVISFGSGDPTRAICSTMLAHAFHYIGYPVLPHREFLSADDDDESTEEEILRARHYSQFTPRDFDLSPYFEVVKPRVKSRFDYRKLHWQQDPLAEDLDNDSW
jgi:hypothetical protein